MKLTLILLLIFAANTASAEELAPSKEQTIVRCTEIREEPGSPTFAFEVLKDSDGYEARYLSLPGDESEPPEVIASFSDLSCQFLSSNRLLLRCQKPGVTIEGVSIVENTLSPLGNQILSVRFQEFRAVGIEVPDILLVFRFGPAATCITRRP